MPLVQISVDPKVVDDEAIKKIAQQLPVIVAKALDISAYDMDGALTANDVEVHVRYANHLDVNTKQLEILILAGDFEERKRTLLSRQEEIVVAIKKIKPPEIKGWVWVVLAPSSFGEF